VTANGPARPAVGAARPAVDLAQLTSWARQHHPGVVASDAALTGLIAALANRLAAPGAAAIKPAPPRRTAVVPPTKGARQTTAQFNAQLINVYYGIHPQRLTVDCVTLDKGRTLARLRPGEASICYRIRDGLPAPGEVARVFGLVDIVAFRCGPDGSYVADAGLLAALERRAAVLRTVRDAAAEDSLASGV